MGSGAFRPFFLLAAAWAAIAVPVWLAAYAHGYVLRGALPAISWHGAFPLALVVVVARELIAGGNWRNLPMLAALGLLLAGNVMVHLHALGIAFVAAGGTRLGIATLCMLIALVGGRLVPSFTRNWLAKARRAPPAPEGALDRIALLVTLTAAPCASRCSSSCISATVGSPSGSSFSASIRPPPPRCMRSRWARSAP